MMFNCYFSNISSVFTRVCWGEGGDLSHRSYFVYIFDVYDLVKKSSKYNECQKCQKRKSNFLYLFVCNIFKFAKLTNSTIILYTINSLNKSTNKHVNIYKSYNIYLFILI